MIEHDWLLLLEPTNQRWNPVEKRATVSCLASGDSAKHSQWHVLRTYPWSRYGIYVIEAINLKYETNWWSLHFISALWKRHVREISESRRSMKLSPSLSIFLEAHFSRTFHHYLKRADIKIHVTMCGLHTKARAIGRYGISIRVTNAQGAGIESQCRI